MDVKTVGAYEILETIGGGGMGVVYKVRHRGADSVLAMKILREELASDPINVKRFQQELKTTSSLTHPNVVPIYDSGLADDGRPYFVMEYLDGLTLEEILRDEGFLDIDRFLQVFTQVSDALIQAHEKRIIHRDLKPSNIMVTTTDTGFELIKVLDFGIARVFQKASKDGARLTQLGDVLGSPTYMSPEQCLSQKLDERSDIYSLGVVMYEALAGLPPFAGENPVEIIMGHLQTRPAVIKKLRPDFNIPDDLESLIYGCLEKEAVLRPQTISDLSAELRRTQSSVKSRSVFYGLKQFPRRLRHRATKYIRRALDSKSSWSKPVVAAASVLIVAGYGYYSYGMNQSVNELVDRAQISLINGDSDGLNQNWSKAVAAAKRNKMSDSEIALLCERAADDLVSHVYKQANISSAYQSWTPVESWRNTHDDDHGASARRARPFLDEAFKRYPNDGTAERIRVLDKLVSVAQSMNDAKGAEALLRSRLSLGSAMSQDGIFQALAGLLETQGRDAEAEAMWKKALNIEQLNHPSPYASSLENLSNLYHRQGKFDSEETLRRDMVEELRHPSNGSNYNYQLRDQLVKLSTCLRKQGLVEEAQRVRLESDKIKT